MVSTSIHTSALFYSLTGNRRFAPRPYKKLPFYFGNQRVLGVIGLPVGECLEVELLFVVLHQVSYPWEGYMAFLRLAKVQ